MSLTLISLPLVSLYPTLITVPPITIFKLLFVKIANYPPPIQTFHAIFPFLLLFDLSATVEIVAHSFLKYFSYVASLTPDSPGFLSLAVAFHSLPLVSSLSPQTLNVGASEGSIFEASSYIHLFCPSLC